MDFVDMHFFGRIICTLRFCQLLVLLLSPL